MPIISYTLPENAGMGFRMVLDCVARQLARRMEMADDTIFFYRGDDEEVKQQPRGALNTAFQKAGFTVPTMMTVTYDKYIVGEKRLNNTMVRTNTPAVYLDDEINAYIKPVYRYTAVNMNITVRFKTRAQARQWLRTVERRLNARITDEYHELEYHYPVPDSACRILCEIYDRKHHWLEDKPESFNEYIQRCLTPRATRIVNQAGKHPTLVIRERMTRVIGSPTYIEGDLMNPDADKSNGTYSATLQYHFEYDAIDGIVVGFPQVVHNKIMPVEILAPLIKKRPDPDRRVEQKSLNRYFIDTAGKVEDEWTVPNSTLRRAIQPSWDEFIPCYVNPQTHIVLSTLVLLSPEQNDTKLLMNLENQQASDDGTWELKPHAIEYMKQNYEYLNKPNEDIFYVVIYSGKDPNWGDAGYVDENLNVRLEEEPEYHKTYRVVICIQFDVGRLGTQALERLRLHYELAKEIILLLYLGKEKLTLREMPDGSMHRGDFDAAVNLLRLQRYKPMLPTGAIHPLVNQSRLRVHSR